MAGKPIQVGEKLPEATFRTLTASGPKEIKASEFFRGRKVVLFAVPGAFTPTCQNQHLPSFVKNAAALKAKGVKEIACVAVNDMFVLDAWQKATGATGVTFLSDGNADFSRAIGMTFDGAGFGMGIRSLRYAMVVDDGVVKTLEVEESPGACSISSGDSILKEI